ncbi:MAG: TetR/AcrR family transcriptional regulator [Rhodoglobus sp.]
MASETSSSRGRPPDPEVEGKVYRGALEIYAESGWAGFTIDAVAARARVGKAAIYRRWTSKDALLIAAIRAAAPETEPSIIEHHPLLRENLRTYVVGLIEALTSPYGLTMLRAQLEAKIFPDVLGVAMETFREEWTREGRALVATGINNGEVPPNTSPALVFDSIRGAVINHYLLSPDSAIPRFVDTREAYAERLVDFVLRGLSA